MVAVSALILLAFVVFQANAVIDLQCPAELLTVFPNGTIRFAQLSEGSGPVDASYTPSAVDSWYVLANGFVDTVRSGSLPYDLLLPVINTTVAQFSSGAASGGFNPISFLQNFASWWAGILAVTLVGIVLGQCFCICGCCFWCCRCCGNCGGGKYQKARGNNDCLMFTFAVILFLVTLFLLAAAVMSFFSNEQTFQVLNNLQTTVNNVVDDTVNYISDTAREVFELACQLISNGGVASSIVNEAEGVGQELITTVQDISSQLQITASQLNLSSLQDVRQLTDNITSTGVILGSTVGVLSSSLTAVLADLASLSAACLATLSPAAIRLCTDVVDPVESSARAALDEIPTVPDFDSLVMNVSNVLEMIENTTSNTQNQSQLIDSALMGITNQLTSGIRGFEDLVERFNFSFGLSAIEQVADVANAFLNNEFIATQCPALDGFQAFTSVSVPNISFNFLGGPASSTSSGSNTPTSPTGQFQLSLGYVRECIINASFNYVKMFDTYRYAFGIIVCSVSLVTIVLVWIGILCGLLGFKKGRLPSERSSLSNCGGVFLLISVGVTFLFGFFLLLLSAIFFFFGANSLKICQALEGPNYDLFRRTIDAPEVRSLVESFTSNSNSSFPVRINEIPTISGFLRECEQQDTALFTALNLGSLFPLPSGSIGGAIRTLLNITELQSSIDSNIINALGDFNNDPGSSSFSNINLGVLNIPDESITSFVAALEQAISRADLNGSIEELRNLSAQFVELGHNNIATEINDLIGEFENVRDNVVPAVLGQVNELMDHLNGIEAILQNIGVQLVSEIAEQLTNISGPVLDNLVNDTIRSALDRSFEYLDQYIDHLENQLQTSVGGCQPVYGIYTQFYNVVCRDFIDGLNGFWWSLGLCAILYIPLIVLATITASFFMKKKTINDGHSDYDVNYPMKDF